ncbi:hypothetical protein [Agrococcus carbonis]|uniref:Uncharacterized protein n=1 Tax=Agrococcus carbonis TaxID=684552 RepID=A0A1H1S1E0_9MICO|nr:hypothetical protein [Agrococcus carbonis]SDS41785.1 hypothetical protein SAMN04489719_2273 [Agrococcus carbonis]
MFKKHAAVLATALLVSGLVAAGAAPASARVLDRYSLDYSESGTVEGGFCGADIEPTYTYDQTGTGVVRTRGDDIEWFHERLRVVQTFTYNGLTVTDIQPNTLAKDHKIVVNDDGTLTITVLFTGGGRLLDDDGRIIAKGSGQIRIRLVIDPDEEEPISEEVVFGSTGTNDDYCAAILDYWGV